ncbi:MAG: spermine/spermidine synthase [Tepidanaerobacteraceae bacterium]
MYQNFQVIERAYTENGEIQLQKRGYDFEIIFNGTFLMATYNGESEKLLVRWAIKEAYSPKRVLIGGLGVGFSLAEALNHKTIEKITVVEIESKIIEWNSLYFSTYSNYALNDPRVDVINADFVDWILNSKEKYDVICLDIDNGPDWVVMDKNNTLYSHTGLFNLVKHINKSGVISFWSASKSDNFERILKKHFNSIIVEEVSLKRGYPDYVYIAKNPKDFIKV